MKDGYDSRSEAVANLTNKIKKAIDFVIEQKIDYSKLFKLYYYARQDYKKDAKMCNNFDYIIIAMDLCHMCCEDSTDFFKDLKVDDELVNSVIDYQISLEKGFKKQFEEHLLHINAYNSNTWAKVDENDKNDGQWLGK